MVTGGKLDPKSLYKLWFYRERDHIEVMRVFTESTKWNNRSLARFEKTVILREIIAIRGSIERK